MDQHTRRRRTYRHPPLMHMLRMRSMADHAPPSDMSAIEVEDCAETKLPVHEEEREVSEPVPGTCRVAGAERVVPEVRAKPCASEISCTWDRCSRQSDGRRSA